MKIINALQRSLFGKWFLIQICFLSLMILISLGLYLYTNFHIKRQIDELQSGNVLTTQTQIETTLDSVKSAANEYAISPNVRTLLKLDPDTHNRNLAMLVDDIKQTNATVPGMLELIVFFKDSGLFVSSAGVMEEAVFAEVYSEGTGGIVQTLYTDADNDEIIPVNYARNGEVINTGMYTKTVGSTIVIAAIVDKAQMKKILLSHIQGEQNLFFVSSDNSQVLFSSINSIEEIDSISYYNTTRKISYSGKEYYCFSSMSEVTGLIYISLISANNYYQSFLNIQTTAVLVLILATTLGIIVSYFTTRYKYKPVQQVMKISRAITPQDIYQSTDDELKQIEYAINFIHNQETQSRKTLSDHSEYIKNDAVKMLLDGEFDDLSATSYVRKLVDVNPGKVYTVAVLEPEAGIQASDTLEQIKAQEPQFQKTRLLHVLAKGGRIIMIYEGRYKDVLAVLAKMSLDNISTAAVGYSEKGLKGVYSSYKNAFLGLSQKIMPGTGKIIPPVDIKRENAVTVSSKDDIRLCGYIQSGENEQAVKMLSELVNISDSKALDVFAYKSYLYNISNTIIRSAEDIKDNTLISELLHLFNVAFAKEDYESITQTLEQAVVMTAERYTQRMKSANDTLNERLVKYIDTNINDPQLSADMIADKFMINQAYLRRFFKEKNGILLWDFINMKRIEAARSLLITSNISIKQICSRCGYISLSTFIRTFKKFTGMTPGHYRNLYR